ncbi:MAG TPA: potassium-transporting ATPase subunit C, partial [Fibrobacteria bacterium]|nr:potassium-transporting ATPase subunit C [Fibrobacteria bacterium]
GSNLGPTSAKLRDSLRVRVMQYRKVNGLSDSVKVPADAVMASGSGLDPEISPANAELQAARVARSRNLDPERLRDLIRENTRGRGLGFLGEPGVNVLTLNLALDKEP